MHQQKSFGSSTEEIFETFFESSNVGMAILDLKLRYRMVNHYLAAAHGAPIESHPGKHVREVLGALSVRVEEALNHVLVTKKPVCGVEIVGRLPGSSTPWHWIVNYFPIADSDGIVKELGAVVLEVPKHVLPRPSENSTPSKGVIRSWKEIAEYVGACVKTVQRWERTLGFPVRRLNRKKGAIVFALSREIDDWLNRTSRFA